jgi:hypothetical protein
MQEEVAEEVEEVAVAVEVVERVAVEVMMDWSFQDYNIKINRKARRLLKALLKPKK